MGNIRKTLAGLMLTPVLLGGGLIGAPAANATPAAPTARDLVAAPRLDSLADLCRGLCDPSKGKNQSAAYKRCAVDLANAHKPTAAELKCYRGAAIAVAAIVADNYISKSEARALAVRLLAAGAFGCIGALWV